MRYGYSLLTLLVKELASLFTRAQYQLSFLLLNVSAHFNACAIMIFLRHSYPFIILLAKSIFKCFLSDLNYFHLLYNLYIMLHICPCFLPIMQCAQNHYVYLPFRATFFKENSSLLNQCFLAYYLRSGYFYEFSSVIICLNTDIQVYHP